MEALASFQQWISQRLFGSREGKKDSELQRENLVIIILYSLHLWSRPMRGSGEEQSLAQTGKGLFLP